MLKLPLGIRSFEELQKDGYFYYDKTDIIYDLISHYKYAFLNRPGKFGKTLLLSTIKSIFQNKKELFKELKIIAKKFIWKERVVVEISLNENFNSLNIEQIKDLIYSKIDFCAKEIGVTLEKQNPYDKNLPKRFDDLLKKAYELKNQKIVVLIDDWDKPLRDNLLTDNLAQINDILVKLYGLIISNDKFIEFAFAVGELPIKSTLPDNVNNFINISLSKKFGNICGFLQSDFEKIKKQDFIDWYDGYYFFGEKLYSYYDVFQFMLNDSSYRTYNLEIEKPDFLIELLNRQNYFLPTLESVELDQKLLYGFEAEDIDTEILLYLKGLLAIKEDNIGYLSKNQCTLKVANKKMMFSFYDRFIEKLYKPNIEILPIKNSIYNAVKEKDINRIESALKSIFTTIDFNKIQDNCSYAGSLVNLLYAYLYTSGLDIKIDEQIDKDNIYFTIEIDNVVCIIEFRVNLPQSRLLEHSKKIAKKYDSDKSIYLVGLSFSRYLNKLEFTKSEIHDLKLHNFIDSIDSSMLDEFIKYLESINLMKTRDTLKNFYNTKCNDKNLELTCEKVLYAFILATGLNFKQESYSYGENITISVVTNNISEDEESKNVYIFRFNKNWSLQTKQDEFKDNENYEKFLKISKNVIILGIVLDKDSQNPQNLKTEIVCLKYRPPNPDKKTQPYGFIPCSKKKKIVSKAPKPKKRITIKTPKSIKKAVEFVFGDKPKA